LEQLAEKPDLVFHTAVSRFNLAYEQLLPMVRHGISVVSSCEELIFPSLREPDLAGRLDAVCHQTGARVVGTGVNPGFVMDVLPLCLAGVSTGIKSIHVERVVNASTRREPLQRKIGSGMDPAAFTELLRSGRAGHAGLKESAALIAHALTGANSQVREIGQALVATREIRTRYVRVMPGQTCGLHQRAETRVNRKLHVLLDLKMYLEAEDPHDQIRIKGTPSIDLRIAGGVAGDQATVAALVNTAPRLLRMSPGLKLLSELGLATCGAC
jgi:4-hydroxy-tetrahydrodipicolinate reductase